MTLPLLFAAATLWSPVHGAELCYKTTSLMWDAGRQRAVAVSPEALNRLRRAFGLWEAASRGALTFRYAGFSGTEHSGVSSVPYDGCVHAVLHGERNFHGELAHGGFNGTIPDGYKRGYFFAGRKPGSMSLETFAHEIGHALGLGHAAAPESIMFSGPRAPLGEALSEQDGADLGLKWAGSGYSISGVIVSGRKHPYANVFAESAAGGRSWSARSDHMGKFVVAVGEPGQYRLAARPVTTASDLNAAALGGMRESWYVRAGESSASRSEAAVLTLAGGASSVSGLRFRTLDVERPGAAAGAAPETPFTGVVPPLEGFPPVVRLSFDGGFDDSGPHRLKSATFGDEVRLAPGVSGQALSVGGTEDWLDVELSTKVVFPSGISVELWFKRDDWENPYSGGAGWQTIASVTTGVSLSVTAPGCPLHPPWALEGSVSRYRKDVRETEMARAFSAGGTVPPRTWMHAALVYDPLEASLTVYLNGVPVDKAKGAAPPDLNIRHIRLGTWHKANQAFRGEIDEVLVFDYARAPDVIARAAGR